MITVSEAPSDAFLSSFAAHRSRFLDDGRATGGMLTSMPHPLPGPAGEQLATDVLRFGPRDAARVLVVVSGTHGIEGFCGSAIQSSLMRSGLYRQLPQNVALVLVHALNPYGFAWLRRTDADNIDLNRNFIDFGQPLRSNPAYDEVHEFLVPVMWTGEQRDAAEAKLQSYIRSRGMKELQAAVFGGQYRHPHGLVFGGRRPAWSNRVWRRILAEHGHAAEACAVIDVHSGLGAPGACELISGARAGSVEHSAALEWFGTGIVFPGVNSTAPSASGYMGDSLGPTLPNAVSALVVAEFGTVDFERIFDVLRTDNWVHGHETPESLLWRSTKAAMYEAFVRPDVSWRRAIVDQGLELTRRVAAALSETSCAALANI